MNCPHCKTVEIDDLILKQTPVALTKSGATNWEPVPRMKDCQSLEADLLGLKDRQSKSDRRKTKVWHIDNLCLTERKCKPDRKTI